MSNTITLLDGTTRENGEVVIGDLDYDGRVALYIIKGSHPPPLHHPRPSTYPPPSRRNLLHKLH
jgi:hypothetical protein